MQGLSTGGQEHGRVHGGDTVMDHDVLERRRVGRQRQAEGDVWGRSLDVTLGKRSQDIILKYLNRVTVRCSKINHIFSIKNK